MLTRRHFLLGSAGALSLAASSFPRPALAQAKPKIVIVGGGAGGVSVLRRLVAEAKDGFDITLIEPQKTYTTCFYSNLFLGGFQPLEVLQHGFDAIAALDGIKIAQEAAASVDRGSRQVLLAGGSTLPYDRLVLSPGIALDYTSVPGWSKEAEDRMPHAWRAGPQTILLKKQLDAVPDGGVVVVIPPPNPYRCPPGPYERVSMMAHVLKGSGRTQARIVILDPKDKFSKQGLFQQGWEKYYPGMIEWLSPMIHGGVKNVDPATMTVVTDFETYTKANLVNVIPRQTAGQIAIDAGLSDATGYCPIDPFSMKSTFDANIFVLGDASIAGDMPKSAFAANSQAQVVAQVIAAELLGAKAADVAYRNRCWSLIEANDSVFVGGNYKPTKAKIAQTETHISGLQDPKAVRRANYEDSAAWYSQITTDLYG